MGIRGDDNVVLGVCYSEGRKEGYGPTDCRKESCRRRHDVMIGFVMNNEIDFYTANVWID
jgi:hypothetical protein